MSQEAVESALAQLRAENARLGEHAEAAVDWLTAGEGLERLSQYGLQHFLWYELPRKWIAPPGEEALPLADVREGLACVLGRVGLERYAFMCRSAITEQVHASYLRSDDEGFRAFGRAMDGSGIEPPDTKGFAWGGLVGIEEALARDAVADALEAAVLSGELLVGRRGWKARQQQLAGTALDRPHPGSWGKSRLQVILEERTDRWCQAARGEGLAALRRRAAPTLREPVAPPEGAAAAFEPLRWFLEAVGDGVRLTANGNLARSFVVDAAVARGWWPLPGSPRGEDDIFELADLHDTARALRAVRRRGRMLHVTGTGRELIRDARLAWERFVAELTRRPGFETVALEALALLLLEHGSGALQSWLFERLAGLLAGEGYRSAAGGEPPAPHHLGWQLADVRRRLELFGMLSVEGDWEARRMAPTPLGAVTLQAILRARATAPRTWEGP